jgi:hypothetical protein
VFVRPASDLALRVRRRHLRATTGRRVQYAARPSARPPVIVVASASWRHAAQALELDALQLPQSAAQFVDFLRRRPYPYARLDEPCLEANDVVRQVCAHGAGSDQ